MSIHACQASLHEHFGATNVSRRTHVWSPDQSRVSNVCSLHSDMYSAYDLRWRHEVWIGGSFSQKIEVGMGYPFNGRKHPRLSGYDYRLANAYFVTIITHGSASLFGWIDGDGLTPTDAGTMIERYIRALPEKFHRLELCEWVVMPDHVHILLTIHPDERDATDSASLSEIVQWFKTMTTNAYIRGVKEQGWAPFDRKVWHTSFHDRIVRSDEEFDAIRHYIQRNPERRWARIQRERC
ncbi:MAG: transposase [Thermomicrobiales bacterium]